MINSIDEAIAHAREKAEEQKKEAETWSEYKVVSEKARNSITTCLECAREYEQLAEWLTELQKRREADRWIPVSERLPDKNGNYLVCLNNGEITTDIFEEEELFMGFWGYMTAWKHLPEPYKENDK